MKKIFTTGIFLLTMFLCSISLSGQSVSEGDIPAAVRKSINTTYPTVKDISWSINGTNYTAVFLLNGVSTTTVIDQGGNMLSVASANSSADNSKVSSTDSKSGSKINYADVPATVKKQVEMKCNPADILSVNKLKDKNGNSVFEFDLASERILYDENGNLINEFTK